MIVWPSDFLAGVRRLCDEHGVLMIADEVLTGFCRTGKMFACEHASIAPDILCLSKAITGGYMPLGATLATEPIFEAFLSEDRTRTFFHGHSFTGNPLAPATRYNAMLATPALGPSIMPARITSIGCRVSGTGVPGSGIATCEAAATAAANPTVPARVTPAERGVA